MWAAVMKHNLVDVPCPHFSINSSCVFFWQRSTPSPVSNPAGQSNGKAPLTPTSGTVLLPALFFVAEVYRLSHMQSSEFMILFLLWTIQHACFFFTMLFSIKISQLDLSVKRQMSLWWHSTTEKNRSKFPPTFFIFGSFISLRCTSQYIRKDLSQLPFYIATLCW